mgnify:CR=1 FL=1
MQPGANSQKHTIPLADCKAFRPIGQIALNLVAMQSLARLEARKSEATHD